MSSPGRRQPGAGKTSRFRRSPGLGPLTERQRGELPPDATVTLAEERRAAGIDDVLSALDRELVGLVPEAAHPRDRRAAPGRPGAAAVRPGGAAAEPAHVLHRGALRAAADRADEGTQPPADLHGAADYRRHLARVLTGRALAGAAGL